MTPTDLGPHLVAAAIALAGAWLIHVASAVGSWGCLELSSGPGARPSCVAAAPKDRTPLPCLAARPQNPHLTPPLPGRCVVGGSSHASPPALPTRRHPPPGPRPRPGVHRPPRHPGGVGGLAGRGVFYAHRLEACKPPTCWGRGGVWGGIFGCKGPREGCGWATGVCGAAGGVGTAWPTPPPPLPLTRPSS